MITTSKKLLPLILIIASFFIAFFAKAVGTCPTNTLKYGLYCDWNDGGKSWNKNAGNVTDCNVETVCSANPSNGTYTLSCNTNTCSLSCASNYLVCSGSSCVYNDPALHCSSLANSNCTAGNCAACVSGYVLCGGSPNTCLLNDQAQHCATFINNCTPSAANNCATCSSGYSLCGSAHSCVATKSCNTWETYDACTDTCVGTPLKLGYDSVLGNSVIQSATYPTLYIPSSGFVGLNTFEPNDIFSIGNSGSAPAGSAATGHNFTSSYLSTDDYALANTGYVKSLISAATSSSALWGGTMAGNIWSLNSGNVGIGTTNPTANLQINNITGTTTLNINMLGTTGSVVDSTYGVYGLNNRGSGLNGAFRYGAYFEAQSYGSSYNSNYGLVGVGNKVGGYGTSGTGVLGIGRHTYNNYNTTSANLIGVQGQVDFTDDSVALSNSGFGASLYTNANIPTNKTLAKYYGLYMAAPTGAGTITSKFGIYQNDSSSPNYFSGNIGIGTTTPITKLFVLGDTTLPQLVIDSGSRAIDLFSGSIGSTLDYSSEGAFSIRKKIYANRGLNASPTTVATFDSNGNVGIGTTNPVEKLQINNGNIVLSQTTETASGTGEIKWQQTVGKLRPALKIFNNASPEAYGYGTNISLWTYNAAVSGADAERLRITSKGNVGIGTTVPNDIFSIGNSGSAPAGSSATGHNFTSSYLSTDDYALANTGYVKSLISAATSSSALWGGTTTGNIWSLASGNVGIGTTTPKALLDVNGNAVFGNSSAVSSVTLNSSNTGSFIIQRGGTNKWSIKNNGAVSDGLEFYNYTTLRDEFYIKNNGEVIIPNGNVGIGTTTPGDKLHIYNSAGSGSLLISGASTSYTEAHIKLQSATNGRGAGVYAFNSGAQTTWFYGNPYGWSTNGSTDSFVISRATGTTLNLAAAASGSFFSINSSGNIGIGTTSPIGQLHVKAGNAATIGLIVQAALSQTANLQQWQNSSGVSVAAIESGGAIMGTQLKWIGGTSGGYLNWGGSTGATLLGRNTGDAYAALVINQMNAGSTGDILDLQAGGVTKMAILQNGNVGIGTTAPNDIFSIGNSGSAPAGSSVTGHNFTSSYLSTDDYALANTGYVKSLISAATTSMVASAHYVGMTASTSNGSNGGYTSANALCSAVVAGSHVCTTGEILNTINNGLGSSIPASSFLWVSNGPPAYTANANDCMGWTSAVGTNFGTIWIKLASGDGFGSLNACDTVRNFACCK